MSNRCIVHKCLSLQKQDTDLNLHREGLNCKLCINCRSYKTGHATWQKVDIKPAKSCKNWLFLLHSILVGLFVFIAASLYVQCGINKWFYWIHVSIYTIHDAGATASLQTYQWKAVCLVIRDDWTDIQASWLNGYV